MSLGPSYFPSLYQRIAKPAFSEFEAFRRVAAGAVFESSPAIWASLC
jgi:hypothetical protein